MSLVQGYAHLHLLASIDPALTAVLKNFRLRLPRPCQIGCTGPWLYMLILPEQHQGLHEGLHELIVRTNTVAGIDVVITHAYA